MMQVQFGTKATRLAVQLEGIPIPPDILKDFQLQADSVTFAFGRGLLTKTEAARCYTRLMKKIANGTPFKKSEPTP